MEKHRILIVEDSPTMRQLLIFALKRLKEVDIVEAIDGMDGLRKVTSDHFDLAFVDINMPVTVEGLSGNSRRQSCRNPLLQQSFQFLPAFIQSMLGPLIEHQLFRLPCPAVYFHTAGVGEASVTLAVDHQQWTGRQLSGHAGAMGLRRQGDHTLNVGTGAPGGYDHRSPK